MESHLFTCPSLQRIWSSPDAILLIFAGGAAEFATIKAVDWLFFTNALPSDPLGRFFATVHFARRVFFSSPAQAAATLTQINHIHHKVEQARGEAIPAWAYRDVLFILIDYGERAHTIVYGPMSGPERQAHFATLIALGQAMHLSDLPTNYEAYCAQRHQQLLDDYAATDFTTRLNTAYRVALGPLRYWLLQLLQGCLLPTELQTVTGLRPQPLVAALLRAYRYLPGAGNKLCWFHGILLPRRFVPHLHELTTNLATLTF